MGLTLDLDPDLEVRLGQEAIRHGLPPERYALQLLRESLPAGDRLNAAALIQSWIDDGDEDEQRETGDYLVQVLDEDRFSTRKLFP